MSVIHKPDKMTKKYENLTSVAKTFVREAFKIFDRDRDGFIDMNELKKVRKRDKHS